MSGNEEKKDVLSNPDVQAALKKMREDALITNQRTYSAMFRRRKYDNEDLSDAQIRQWRKSSNRGNIRKTD
ncbi:hypothetical protein HN670_03710 [bacterium]|jgi:hypothetical protein|nr:hypothetical protein [bacterium]